MKLYYAPGACSLAPHIVLEELGLQFQTEAVDLGSKQTTSGADFTSVNPKGYVPALEFEHGEVLTEAVAILQFLADRYPAAQLAPPCGTLDRARLQAHMHFVGAELHKAFGPLFNPHTTEEAKQAAIASVGRKLDIMESALGEGRSFLVGGRYSIADAYLFVVARWTDRFAIQAHDRPRLAAFLERVGARPAVRTAIAAEESAGRT